MAEARTDPGTTAYQLSEHVHDTEDGPDTYLQRFVDELHSLEPGLRQHVSDLVIGDLKEEVLQDDTEFAAACRSAIANIETKWRSDDR
jgi:SOS response regulatory protein OraA/RecX